MGAVLQKGTRYWHTLKYLRISQVVSRVQHRFRYINVDFSLPCEDRQASGNWVLPCKRRQRMFGKQVFCFLNETHEIKQQADWNHHTWSKLWLYNLHYFDDLIADDADSRVDWHRYIIQRWIEDNRPVQGNGWEPYPLSLRIVNWIKWALAGNELDEVWRLSLAVQVRALSKSLETHLLGNHLFANAKALIFAGLYFQGEEADKWYRLGRNVVERELPEQVLPDGGNYELSTMYHAIFLEDLLDLINVHRTYQRSFCPHVESVIPAMNRWLSLMSHPDGEISFFNDAAIGVAPNITELTNYAKRLGVSEVLSHSRFQDLPDSGYSRVEIDDAVAIIDRANLGPDFLPGHGHADTLSFELSLFGHRVIVNSGCSMYGTGVERQRQRGSSAHSTVTIDGENSSEVWGGFRVARRARIHQREHLENNDRLKISACHDGYQRLPGKPVHHREWSFSNRSIVIKDNIQGELKHHIEVIMQLHPVVEVIGIQGSKATLSVAGNIIVVESTGDGCLELEKSTFHPEFGLNVASSKLVYRCHGLLPKQIVTKISW